MFLNCSESYLDIYSYLAIADDIHCFRIGRQEFLRNVSSRHINNFDLG